MAPVPNQFANETTPVELVKLDENFSAFQSSTGSSLVGFNNGGVGSTTRTSEDKMRDIISVKDFGAVGTGFADDRAAIAAAFVAATEVYFPPGTYLVGSNLTVAANKVVRMAAGAAFSVAAGVTLTINAHFEGDPDSYHFQGAGSVVGVVDVYPEWFGAVGNGTADDQPAFQRASACVKSDGSVAAKCTIRLQAKNYLLSSSWTVEPTANRPIDVIGMGTLIGGSRLLSSTTNTGPLMVIEGNTDATQSLV
ncbi:MAG: glycosyl hydrolase family 28-related protein, partial [bacterium]